MVAMDLVKMEGYVPTTSHLPRDTRAAAPVIMMESTVTLVNCVTSSVLRQSVLMPRQLLAITPHY